VRLARKQIATAREVRAMSFSEALTWSLHVAKDDQDRADALQRR